MFREYVVVEGQGRLTMDIIMTILSGISFYLLIIEVVQLFKQGIISYLSSVWNYLDISPSVLVCAYMYLDYRGDFDDLKDLFNVNRGVMRGSLNLLVWIKLLYFLRLFKETGYLIRIIVQVIKDMKYFLLLLLLTIIAFGQAIQAISDEAEEPFVG